MKTQFAPNTKFTGQNMNNPPIPQARLRNKTEFTGTLCSNCHGTNCLSVFFCPCVLYGKNRAHLNEIDAPVCSGDCWIFLGAIACNPILYSCLLAMSRRDLRVKSNLEGNAFLDFLQSLFCPCCVLLQDNEELDKKGAYAFKPM